MARRGLRQNGRVRCPDSKDMVLDLTQRRFCSPPMLPEAPDPDASFAQQSYFQGVLSAQGELVSNLRSRVFEGRGFRVASFLPLGQGGRAARFEGLTPFFLDRCSGPGSTAGGNFGL